MRKAIQRQPTIVARLQREVVTLGQILDKAKRLVTQTGRGYSFEALRAKILCTESVCAFDKRPKFQRREAAPMYGVPPEGFMGKMIMSPVVSYPHEGNEAERNFGAHISTLVELIESGLI